MSAETTVSGAGSESFSSRLRSVLRLRQSGGDHDLIALNAKERSGIMFKVLSREHEKRGIDPYSVLDKLESWEVQAKTDTDGDLSPTHYVLTRKQTSRGRFNRRGSTVMTAESFSFYPAFVFYLDLSSARITYNPINSEKTLVAAERIMISLFPVGAAVREVPTQLSEMLK